MEPFGTGDVVVEHGFITDDGDFYTANKERVDYRWVKITREGGVAVYGYDPPKRVEKGREQGLPLFTREYLTSFKLSALVPGPGNYYIRLWGGNATDPNWFEIGSGDPNTNGQTTTIVGTAFAIGETPPPPPNNEKQELIEVLLATKQVNRNGYAFKHNGAAALTVDSYLDDAIARAKRL